MMGLLETVTEKVFRTEQVEDAVVAVQEKIRQLSCKCSFFSVILDRIIQKSDYLSDFLQILYNAARKLS